MFIVSWLFDKLGYMPKIDVQVGVIHAIAEEPKKPTVKKATTRGIKKPAVAAKTSRTKKVK